jgi:hypothetical protein
MTAPVDPSEIATDVLEELRKLGYTDAAELAADLASENHTMAKVFYFMLTRRMDFDRIDWSQAVAAGDDRTIMFQDSPTSFAITGSDPFHRQAGVGSDTQSLVLSYASRPDWADVPEDRPTLEKPREFLCRGRAVIDVLRIVQALVRQLGVVWCHPDDLTILARNEAAGLDVVFQVWQTTEGDVAVAVHKYAGGADAFEAICSAVDCVIGPA